MPTASEPRISVRFSAEELEAVERAARVAGVATGALVRECAVNYCALVAANRRADRAAGREVRKLRARGVTAVQRQVERHGVVGV